MAKITVQLGIKGGVATLDELGRFMRTVGAAYVGDSFIGYVNNSNLKVRVTNDQISTVIEVK